MEGQRQNSIPPKHSLRGYNKNIMLFFRFYTGKIVKKSHCSVVINAKFLLMYYINKICFFKSLTSILNKRKK